MNDHPATPLEAAGPALMADAVRAFGAVRLRALGGSMEPAILPRDILVVARCEVGDLKLHDIVVFARDGRIVAHRLLEVGVSTGSRLLVTRGDALWRADAPVAPSDLLGRVIAVGHRGIFRAPAACTPLGRLRGLVASECTALRLRIQR